MSLFKKTVSVLTILFFFINNLSIASEINSFTLSPASKFTEFEGLEFKKAAQIEVGVRLFIEGLEKIDLESLKELGVKEFAENTVFSKKVHAKIYFSETSEITLPEGRIYIEPGAYLIKAVTSDRDGYYCLISQKDSKEKPEVTVVPERVVVAAFDAGNVKFTHQSISEKNRSAINAYLSHEISTENNYAIDEWIRHRMLAGAYAIDEATTKKTPLYNHPSRKTYPQANYKRLLEKIETHLKGLQINNAEMIVREFESKPLVLIPCAEFEEDGLPCISIEGEKVDAISHSSPFATYLFIPSSMYDTLLNTGDWFEDGSADLDEAREFLEKNLIHEAGAICGLKARVHEGKAANLLDDSSAACLKAKASGKDYTVPAELKDLTPVNLFELEFRRDYAMARKHPEKAKNLFGKIMVALILGAIVITNIYSCIKRHDQTDTGATKYATRSSETALNKEVFIGQLQSAKEGLNSPNRRTRLGAVTKIKALLDAEPGIAEECIPELSGLVSILLKLGSDESEEKNVRQKYTELTIEISGVIKRAMDERFEGFTTEPFRLSPDEVKELVRSSLEAWLKEGKNAYTRSLAVQKIAEIIVDEETRVKLLAEALNDKEAPPRCIAGFCLTKENLENPLVIRGLEKAAKDTENKVRGAVGAGLRQRSLQMTADRQAELPVPARKILETLLRDQATHIRVTAALALSANGWNPPQIIEVLIDGLEAGNNDIQAHILDSLAREPFSRGIIVPGLIETLTAFLDSPDPKNRFNAAGVFFKMGKSARSAFPALKSAYEIEEDRRVKGFLLYALFAVYPENPAGTDLLDEAFRSPDAELRGSAAVVLGEVGTPDVLPFLENMLKTEPNERVRKAIRDAIRKIREREGAGQGGEPVGTLETAPDFFDTPKTAYRPGQTGKINIDRIIDVLWKSANKNISEEEARSRLAAMIPDWSVAEGNKEGTIRTLMENARLTVLMLSMALATKGMSSLQKHEAPSNSEIRALAARAVNQDIEIFVPKSFLPENKARDYRKMVEKIYGDRIRPYQNIEDISSMITNPEKAVVMTIDLQDEEIANLDKLKIDLSGVRFVNFERINMQNMTHEESSNFISETISILLAVRIIKKEEADMPSSSAYRMLAHLLEPHIAQSKKLDTYIHALVDDSLSPIDKLRYLIKMALKAVPATLYRVMRPAVQIFVSA